METGMRMQSTVAALIEEAEQQVRDKSWQLLPEHRTLARQTATGLDAAVGPAPDQEALSDTERLAHLREALAVLALTLARTHGPLAWFIGAGAEALSPVLNWRTLPPNGAPRFGTTHPTPPQLTAAEDAVRRLAAALGRLAA
ncbi:hypothetical protein AB0A60_21195 [Streptomyces sp. NPDC046275]|uniref:hypothetical protein n=1 Tax=Streptomyces sp. NPDC046275 TaxID=3157201 RepID=UPI0033E2C1DB